MRFNFNLIINLFFAIVLSYVIAIVVSFFFKPLPIYYYPNKQFIEFFDVKMSKDLFLPVIHKKKIVNKINYLKDFKLKAVYSNGKDGFVIVEYNKKSIFIDLHKEFKGYKLIKINLNSAVFSKDGEKYTLKLLKSSKGSKKASNTPRKITYPKKIMNNIQRQVINYYRRNLGIVWQNIGLQKVKNYYKITYIKPNSIFTKLGLRQGDILLEVNGRKLKNDYDAWNLYKNINKFDEVKLKILRNNKTKVVSYEIN